MCRFVCLFSVVFNNSIPKEVVNALSTTLVYREIFSLVPAKWKCLMIIRGISTISLSNLGYPRSTPKIAWASLAFLSHAKPDRLSHVRFMYSLALIFKRISQFASHRIHRALTVRSMRFEHGSCCTQRLHYGPCCAKRFARRVLCNIIHVALEGNMP